MVHSALDPVFVGLRTALNVLVVGLAGFVVVRAVADGDRPVLVTTLALVFLATYATGFALARRSRGPRAERTAAEPTAAGDPSARGRTAPVLWVGALTLEWFALVWTTADAAYIVFPLFFLFLHVLPMRWAIGAVVVSTGLSIVGIGVRGTFTVGGVVGPLVGAAVATAIGLAARALARESAERERLLGELLAAETRLAATERESGVLAERARLAREIHDTVAQGLSSIQMLLHAAERADGDRPGIEHVRLARETAATNLAEARRFIRELAPPTLEDHGLSGALRRLAATEARTHDVDIRVTASDHIALPMATETALLRVAQGAVANVVRHAGARHATIDLTRDGDRAVLTVSDDGRGFDPTSGGQHPHAEQDDPDSAHGRLGSFGLRAMRERADQFGGGFAVESRIGHGTTIVVSLPIQAENETETETEPETPEESS